MTAAAASASAAAVDDAAIGWECGRAEWRVGWWVGWGGGEGFRCKVMCEEVGSSESDVSVTCHEPINSRHHSSPCVRPLHACVASHSAATLTIEGTYASFAD